MGFVIRAMHVKLYVTGKELIPNEPFLLVQNHRHGLDPIMTVHCFRKHKIAFITKKKILKLLLQEDICIDRVILH